MALFTQLVSMFGMPGALLIVAGASILGVVAANLFAHWLVNQILAHGQSPTAAARLAEREAAARRRLKASERIDAMDDAGLQALIKKRPQDAFALGKWCERLKERGDLTAYALARERLLSIDGSMNVAEKSTGCHLLADFYLRALSRPDQAKRVLKDFIAQHPDSAEAAFMRERLARMEATPAGDDAKKGSSLPALGD